MPLVQVMQRETERDQDTLFLHSIPKKLSIGLASAVQRPVHLDFQQDDHKLSHLPAEDINTRASARFQHDISQLNEHRTSCLGTRVVMELFKVVDIS